MVNADRISSIMRIAFLAAIVAAAILTTGARAQSTDSTYFPMDVGNFWNMAWILDNPFMPWDTLDSGTFSIAGTTTIGTTKYTLLSPGKRFLSSDTIRAAEDGNIYSLYHGKEYLLFDFSAEGDSAYTYPFEYSAHTDTFAYYVNVRERTSCNTFVGTFQNCISFYFDVPGAIDEEKGYTFAPAIGLVSFGGAWEHGSLYGAQVRDRAYVVGVDDPGEPPSRDPLVTLYPNPTRNNLILQIRSNQPAVVAVELFDVLGREVGKIYADVTSGTNRVELDVSNLATGTYAARITTTGPHSSAQERTFVVAR